MFRPNQSCVIQKASGKNDAYGMPLPGVRHTERCAIVEVRIRSEKSSVRADSSASRGSAMELETDAKFLLAKTSRAAIDDLLIHAGTQYRINSKHARYDLQGRLDHYEITCTYWSAQ